MNDHICVPIKFYLQDSQWAVFDLQSIILLISALDDGGSYYISKN